MAAKGDSKQGLVITLVFFVLLSILLGVVAYFGYSEQDALAKDRDQKVAEKKNSDEVREYYRWQSLMARAYMGHLPAKDMEELGVLTARYAPLDPQTRKRNVKDLKTKDRDDIVTMLEALDKDLLWNEAQKKPTHTYKSELAKRDDRIKELETGAKTDAARLAKADSDLKGMGDELKKAKADYDAELAKFKQVGQQDLQKYLDKVAELQKEIDALGQVRTTLQTDIAALQEKQENQVKKYQKDIDLLQIRLTKAEEKVPKVNIVELGQPKGKIVEIDRSGQMPFINLGRADNVKPGLTFSIHATDPTGKASKESKGSLEVLEVLGERLSQARITALRDPGREPVLKGDLLLNAAWSPHLKQHVAIAGIVDLTGDTHHDNVNQQMRALLEFKRTLEEQNVVVDAYLDLKDNTVKGTISRQTDYLILGTAPGLDAAAPIKEEDPKGQRQTKVAEAMAKMQQEANANGVTVIPLRRFLILTGYRLPRAVGTEAPSYNFRPTNPAVPSPLDRRPPVPPPPDKNGNKIEK